MLALGGQVGELFPLRPAIETGDLVAIKVLLGEAATGVMIGAAGLLAGWDWALAPCRGRCRVRRLGHRRHHAWLNVFSGWPPSLDTTDLPSLASRCRGWARSGRRRRVSGGAGGGRPLSPHAPRQNNCSGRAVALSGPHREVWGSSAGAARSTPWYTIVQTGAGSSLAACPARTGGRFSRPVGCPRGRRRPMSLRAVGRTP